MVTSAESVTLTPILPLVTMEPRMVNSGLSYNPRSWPVLLNVHASIVLFVELFDDIMPSGLFLRTQPSMVESFTFTSVSPETELL